jgi:protein disulfide-isomerase-like protein
MNKTLLIFLAFTTLANVIAAEGDTLDINSEPPHLTVETFDELVIDRETNTLKGDKPWMIKFYAPWCGHCKRMAPVWTELFQKNKEEFNVAKVDCTQDEAKGLCSQFKVKGYPSVKLFNKDNKAYNFKR